MSTMRPTRIWSKADRRLLAIKAIAGRMDLLNSPRGQACGDACDRDSMIVNQFDCLYLEHRCG
jgi:hypothetical protein